MLLSGGLDSATAAAWAVAGGLPALGPLDRLRPAAPLRAGRARAVAAALGIADHVVLPVDLAAFGGSALVDPAIAVPKGRSDAEIGHGIPITYVPARNTVFLALALAMAETRGAEAIVIGVNAIDYSGYPDCRPEFLDGVRPAGAAGHEGGRGGEAARDPRAARRRSRRRRSSGSASTLGLDYGLTTSCYDPDAAGRPCGTLRLVPAAGGRLRRGVAIRGAIRLGAGCASHPASGRPDVYLTSMSRMRIAEIYASLQGEGLLAGTPEHVRAHERLQPALPLVRHAVHVVAARGRASDAWPRCSRRSTSLEPRHVVVTGGEPLLFADVADLCRRLRATGCHVTIETAGTVLLDAPADLDVDQPQARLVGPAGRHAGRLGSHGTRPPAGATTCSCALVAGGPYQLKFVDRFGRRHRRGARLGRRPRAARPAASTAAACSSCRRAARRRNSPRRQPGSAGECPRLGVAPRAAATTSSGSAARARARDRRWAQARSPAPATVTVTRASTGAWPRGAEREHVAAPDRHDQHARRGRTGSPTPAASRASASVVERVDHRRTAKHDRHHRERLAAAGEGEDRAERAEGAERSRAQAPERARRCPTCPCRPAARAARAARARRSGSRRRRCR